MEKFTVTFESHAGDTCEVAQPANDVIDAVRAVHKGYGHIAARTDNGGVFYATSLDGTPLRVYADRYGRVSIA